MRFWCTCISVCLATTIAAARPNTVGSKDLYHYASGDVVESIGSAGGHFKIWFTRAGVNAVPLGDANGNGVPDDVEEVAAIYEEALALYTKVLGYRAPISDANQTSDNGGDGRFDVYLLDFGGSADGHFVRESCDADNVCTGYMDQQCDFSSYPYPSQTIGNRVVASHEFFHATQAAYDDGESSILGEGTAVWATNRFDGTLKDFEGFVPGYLSRPDHSLDLPLPGPVDPFSYGTCLFFQFLSERFGDVVIRELWEASVGASAWWGSLDGVMQMHQNSFADAFATFARWNLFTGVRANPALAYAKAGGYSRVKIESDPAPLTVASVRVFEASSSYYGLAPAGRTTMDASLVVPAGVDGSPLRLALAVRRGNAIAAPIVADASLRATAATDGADELIVVVTSTAQAGESLRPGLCVGDATEVDRCRAQLGVVAAMPDMGSPEMMPPPMQASGGCAIGARHDAPTATVIAALLGLLLALTVRRRNQIQW